MFSFFNRKREKSHTAHLEFPINNDAQRKHMEACLKSPKLVLALKDVMSISSEKECRSQAIDTSEKIGMMKAFNYIRENVRETLGKDLYIIE